MWHTTSFTYRFSSKLFTQSKNLKIVYLLPLRVMNAKGHIDLKNSTEIIYIIHCRTSNHVHLPCLLFSHINIIMQTIHIKGIT